MHFSKILIGTDFSPESESAFDLAAYNKKMDGSEIILLHVYRIFEPVHIGDMGFWDPTLINDYSENYRESALKRLKEIAEKTFHNQEVRCEVILSKTGIAEEFCEFANKENCDLIVMGSRGHTTLGTLLVGSVLQQIILQTKCPVLIVPPTDSK